MDMDKLLRPKSIAIIGATDKPEPGNFAANSVVQGSNGDRVYYVNPELDELFGRKCYHSLAELPEIVDCVIICTPAKTVAGYLEECGQRGVGAAVVLASGFEEERTEEAKAMAAEVKTACEKYDLAVEGPNCVGFVNAVDNICGAVTTKGLLNWGTTRGFAVVAQSGYIPNGFTSGFPERISYMVSAGNCTKCTLEDYMLYFAKDERVTGIAAYIEGVRKPEVLTEALALAAIRRKPVVVLKTGMTELGSFAAASHTGSVAGDYSVYEAIFKKFGVILTQSQEEFVSTARAFAVLDGNLPTKPGVGAINFSGGENTLCADTCGRIGVSLPQFSEKTIETIRSVVPSFSTASNPLDATTDLFTDRAKEKEKVRTLFSAITNDDNIGLITLGDDMGVQSEHKDVCCVEVVSEMKASGVLGPCVVVPSVERARNPEFRKAYEDAGCPVLSTGDYAYRAIRHICEFSAYNPEEHILTISSRTMEPGIVRKPLSEAASKQELSDFGVRFPLQKLAVSVGDLEEALKAVGCPVMMKVESADIAHKTEAGGVKLGIRSVEEARKAFQEIMSSCRAYAPDAKIDGVMVQEYFTSGTEMILGIKNDRQFGPILLAGLGGVYTEIYKDIALCPCPLNREEAQQMLRSLKGYRLLTGYRGTPQRDVEAVVDMMMQLSNYAVQKKDELAELDLNSVIVGTIGDGAVAVDALVVKEDR